LGGEGVTQLLVEGGGNTHAGFLEQGQVHAVAFYYAPKVLGGIEAARATGGSGFRSLETSLRLEGTRWKSVGGDLLLTAIVARADTRPGVATI
jgi:diaminohydroxyphosphoribosylaminopyrimidine deaminase/5-amino-6-(5-phosphoribosylamino)uracil reductase